MRLRICRKIPPAILAGLIITIVVINKEYTTEKEEGTSNWGKEGQAQSNTNEFEQSKEVKEGEGVADNTLQKVQEDYKQHMKDLQEKRDLEVKESDSGKDVLIDNQQKSPKDKEAIAQIQKGIEPPKDNVVQTNKQSVQQEKPSVHSTPNVTQNTKAEPKPIDNIIAIDQARVKPYESEIKGNPMVGYKNAVENDMELQTSKNKFGGIVTLAQNILSPLPNPKILLLSFVHEDNAVFANNWLCNAQVLDIHSSLIIVTYGSESKELLSEKWPLLNLYPIKPDTPEETLRGTPHTLTKLQIIYVLLNAGINILLLDVESVWFTNPVPSFKSGGADMMVNIASSVHVNSGFIVLFATEKNKYFWGSLYLQVKQFEKMAEVSIESQYDKLLQKMTVQRFGSISFKELPNESYIEGTWYEMTDEERQKTRPIVIRNNNLLGFAKRIRRAVIWKHWFLVEENVCDLERVTKLVKKPPQV